MSSPSQNEGQLSIQPGRPISVDTALDDDWRKRELKARLFGQQHAPLRFGRFVVLGTLGRGGMGSVHKAYDETLERPVAVKVMHRRQSDADDARALREAQALARLSHPNVVQVYEVGQIDGRLFIAMELLVGETLREWQESKPSWEQSLEAYRQAGLGLAAAHSADLVHRDFKPSNCVIDPDGRVRVLDFGLARNSGVPGRALASAPTDENIEVRTEATTDSFPSQPGTAGHERRLTETGSVAGTVGYMAPEQLRGKEVDARADQFSFCVALYESWFGRPPFSHKPMPSLMKMAAGEEVEPAPPPAGSRVPRVLFRVLARGLSARPEDRWPSMDALLDALDRPASQKRWQPRAIGVLALGMAVAGAWASTRGEETCAEAEKVGQVWNEAHKELVQESYRATSLNFAADSAKKLTDELDAYANRLDDAHIATCVEKRMRRSRRRQVLEAKSSCLELNTQALRYAVDELEHADESFVLERRGISLVTELPSIESCLDVKGPSPEKQLPARGSLTDARRRALRERIVRARTLEISGKAEEGLTMLESALADAGDIAGTRLGAEAQLIEGRLLSALGKHEDAYDGLGRAMRWALENDEMDLATESLAALVYVAGVELERVDIATVAATVAEPWLEQEGPDPRAKARVLTSRGQIHSELEEHDLARPLYERALDLLNEAVGPEHIDLADPLDSLANVLRHQKNYDEAVEASKRALEIRREWLGDSHPQVAHQRINLSLILDRQGNHDAAQREFNEAEAVLLAAGEDRLALFAHLHGTMGASLARQRRFDEAVVYLRKAVEGWEAEHGPDHQRVALLSYSLARTLEDAGDWKQARKHYDRAREIFVGHEPSPGRDKWLKKIDKAYARHREAREKKESGIP